MFTYQREILHNTNNSSPSDDHYDGNIFKNSMNRESKKIEHFVQGLLNFKPMSDFDRKLVIGLIDRDNRKHKKSKKF